MNILLILVTFTLLVISAWLFYTVKTKRKKVEFTYKESNKSWVVSKTNYWIILKTYIRENSINFIVVLILISILIALGIYYFYGESALGSTLAILLALLATIGSSLLTGSASSDEEISSGTESFFKVFKETVENIKGVFIKEKNENIVYSGYVELPSKIYVDESANIIINLFGEVLPTKLNREYMESFQSEELKLIDIHIQRKQDVAEFLRVELQTASLKIGGEASQIVDLVNNNIKFQWSISSEKPTFHQTVLIFLKLSGALIKNLGEIEHSVKVVNLFGLTRRQVFISAGITGLLGLIPAIGKMLEILGYTSKN